MKRISSSLVVVLTILLVGGAPHTAAGEESACEGESSPLDDYDQACSGPAPGALALCHDCGADTGFCRCGPVWYGEFEALYLGYNRSDGLTSDLEDPNAVFDYDYELTPRATLGAVFRNGMGLRLRYLEHDHAEPNAKNEVLDINAKVVDLELFENIQFTHSSALEWGIGVRYCEFTEMIDSHPLLGDALWRTHFEGTGVVAGVEINRMVRWGTIYGRGRSGFLYGDREINAPGISVPEVIQNDVTPGMIEAAFGWETSHTCSSGLILTAGIGWEFQRWIDFSVTRTNAILPTTPIDVGFSGAVLNLAIGY